LNAAGLAMVVAARFWTPAPTSHRSSTVLLTVTIDVLVNAVVVVMTVLVLLLVRKCSRA